MKGLGLGQKTPAVPCVSVQVPRVPSWVPGSVCSRARPVLRVRVYVGLCICTCLSHACGRVYLRVRVCVRAHPGEGGGQGRGHLGLGRPHPGAAINRRPGRGQRTANAAEGWAGVEMERGGGRGRCRL